MEISRRTLSLLCLLASIFFVFSPVVPQFLLVRYSYAISAIVLLSLLPGLVLLSFCGFESTSSKLIGYSLPLSWFVVLTTDLIVVTLGHTFSQIRFDTPTLAIATSVGFIVFAVGCLLTPRANLSVEFNIPDTRVMCLGGVLVLLSITSSVYLNATGKNIFALILFILIAIFASILISSYASLASRVFGIYTISLSLIWQNLLRTPYFSRFGDTIKEYYVGHLTIVNHSWNMSFATGKNAMLYLSLLYPHYSLVSHFSLIQIYQIVYPLFFALLPVTLLHFYRRITTEGAAIAATIAFVFIGQFFRLLSRSTRTGAALLLVVLFFLCIYEKPFKRNSTQKLYQISILLTLVVTHYATAFLFVGILLLTRVSHLFAKMTTPQSIQGYSPTLTQVSLFAGVIFVWYSSVATSVLLRTPTFALYFAAKNLIKSFIFDSSTTQMLTHSYHSPTSTIIKYGYIAITGISGVGYLREAYALYIKKQTNLDYSKLYLSTTGFLLVAIGFAPVGILKFNRIFVIGSIFFLPLGFETVYWFFERIRFPRATHPALCVALLMMILVTAGMFGATVLPERPHQINLKRHGILQNGSNSEKERLFISYYSPYDYQATRWAHSYAGAEEIYGPNDPYGLLTYFTTKNYSYNDPPGRYKPLTNKTDNSKGLVYISYYTTLTGDINTNRRIIGNTKSHNITYQREFGNKRCNIVYQNGNSKFIYGACQPQNSDKKITS